MLSVVHHLSYQDSLHHKKKLTYIFSALLASFIPATRMKQNKKKTFAREQNYVRIQNLDLNMFSSRVTPLRETQNTLN